MATVCCLDELTPFVVSDEREFRHLNLAFGSSRIASSAYQKWPTRNSQSPSGSIKKRLSFAPIPKFDDRFARQNRYEPPPEFPLASPYSGIVHHLSGPNIHAPPRIRPKSSGPGVDAPHDRDLNFHFHCALGFSTQILAGMLDSLVRVSRRVA
ncbi:hypothetical protein AGABI2DRAFT_121457 [Agaricus bisporus var. bisporus H97]|uniref:hypothetical protein n=1 Tax=Agaricus bisporus var. bisporus (strain H97 / ATCC MYA-4626 / FGSC 10389) TaxID=936046 RepID=UPI00029F6CA3|nr:hypothetical protein AGABI2DRAFT_121457 [Agaricus bisporus var. bisporus H97]EKV44281.1 hypothetical protein AGABI2DRAFT_121457 [Agaricus bisporus var. bisporus H97]